MRRSCLKFSTCHYGCRMGTIDTTRLYGWTRLQPQKVKFSVFPSPLSGSNILPCVSTAISIWHRTITCPLAEIASGRYLFNDCREHGVSTIQPNMYQDKASPLANIAVAMCDCQTCTAKEDDSFYSCRRKTGLSSIGLREGGACQHSCINRA